jgi:putative nucleotidyltransferase with HDIG domain
MISSQHYTKFNLRYKEYIDSLKITDPYILEHVNFKTAHTYRVVANIQTIARETGLSAEDVQIAKIIGLVHDIGRHEQFMKYRTFDDSISVNHAILGVSILNKLCFFDGLIPADSTHLIIQAVLNHNVQKLDEGMEARLLLFSRLIRDADKADIWKTLSMMNIVFKILDNELSEQEYVVPTDFLKCFREERIVPSGAVTINDYRLLRLSWIYDMNFQATFRLILKKDLTAKILAKIPASPEKDEIADIIQRYITRRAA